MLLKIERNRVPEKVKTKQFLPENSPRSFERGRIEASRFGVGNTSGTGPRTGANRGREYRIGFRGNCVLEGGAIKNGTITRDIPDNIYQGIRLRWVHPVSRKRGGQKWCAL